MAIPTVQSVVPASGTDLGGTTVTITGTNFTGTTGVTFGGTSAPFVVNSATQISAFAPAHGAGTVSVQVTNADGTSSGGGNQFTFQAALPVVSNVNPNTGPTTGGVAVTVSGNNFTNATAVSFGGIAAEFAINSANEISAFAPAHASGFVHVQVTNPDGTSTTNANDQFNYPAALPTVSSVGPASGPTAGGTTVSIAGTNFANAIAVSFGGTDAEFVINSGGQITAFAPTHSAGLVHIQVTNPDGTSTPGQNDQFNYQPAMPVVNSLTPSTGLAAGGTTVSIAGMNFANATGVSFGGKAAQFAINSATQISAFSPPGTAGAVHVQVTNPDGTSPAGGGDQFTYT
jgi:hypothetical protein